MNRIIKLPTLEGGNFSGNNNRMTFKLPAGSNFNLNNGYVNLYTSVSSTESVEVNKKGIYNFVWKYAGQAKYILDNEAIVKNAHMRSRRLGYMQDLRQVGKREALLKRYEENSEMQEGRRFDELGQLYQVSELKGNIHREFIKEGNEPSRELRTPIRIPLNKIFRGVANLPYISTEKLDEIEIQLELNLDKLSADNAKNLPNGITEIACDNIAAGDDNVELKTTNPFISLEVSPFWVGQKIKIDSNTGVSQYRLITQIIHEDTNKLTITVDEALNGATASNIKISPVNAATFPITYDYAEIMIEEVMNPEKMDGMALTYTTFTTEEHSIGAEVLQYNKIFNVEPEAVNLFVVLNNTDNSLLSSAGGKGGSYRVSVDNNPITNRDVSFRSPLHYDLVNKTFVNAGMILKNLNERALLEDEQRFAERHSGAKIIEAIMTPLPMTPQQKQVQINLELKDTNKFNLITLYKQVIKEIKI